MCAMLRANHLSNPFERVHELLSEIAGEIGGSIPPWPPFHFFGVSEGPQAPMSGGPRFHLCESAVHESREKGQRKY